MSQHWGMKSPYKAEIVVTLVLATTLGAQSPTPPTNATGYPAADSATSARAAWRRATSAMQVGDIATARAEADRAVNAWPTQEVFLWGRVVLAARAGDTSGVVSALDAYADIGIGRDFGNEPSIKAFMNSPQLQASRARHTANRAPLARSTVRATLPDSTFWPEGMDHDPRTGAFYVTSLRHRTIAEWRDGTTRELIARGRSDLGAILAVRVDTARGLLWATTSGIPQQANFTPADTAIVALLRIRIADGSIERRWDLPVASGGRVPGDVAIGPRGDVYISDSQHPELYRLAPGSDSLIPIRHPLFRSLQGIAPTPDPNILYVADYSHGILRVDFARQTVTRVGDAPRSTSLGIDGLTWHRGALIAIQNGVAPARVMQYSLDAAGTHFTRAEVLDRNSAIADEPTIGTLVGDAFVYVANSQWEKYDAAGRPRPNATLTRPVLLSLPIPR
ncbi:MAG: hypothetical protein P3A28_10220 [Gemmatimonadota bacterium]|nr:hypothetical protein [Gemmatimonadota bacterium]